MSPKLASLCLFLFAAGAASQIVGQAMALHLFGAKPRRQPTPEAAKEGEHVRTEPCPFCAGRVAFFTGAVGHAPPTCTVWDGATLDEFSDMRARLLVGRATTKEARA